MGVECLLRFCSFESLTFLWSISEEERTPKILHYDIVCHSKWQFAKRLASFGLEGQKRPLKFSQLVFCFVLVGGVSWTNETSQRVETMQNCPWILSPFIQHGAVFTSQTQAEIRLAQRIGRFHLMTQESNFVSNASSMHTHVQLIQNINLS